MAWGQDTGGGDRVRAHIAQTGLTFFGQAVWSPAEDEAVRLLYPDYKLLQSAIPDRSLKAIKNRVRSLGVQQRRHVWTNTEILRLRGLYSRNASTGELLAAFPGLRQSQICGQAGHLSLTRKRKPYKVLGIPILDTIRSKAHACGFTMVDLDEVARTRRYFRSTTRRVMWKYVARAIVVLEGSLHVRWDTEEERQAVDAYRVTRH